MLKLFFLGTGACAASPEKRHASDVCKFSNQLLQGTPIKALRFTAREFRSAVKNKFGVPQGRCLLAAWHPVISRTTRCGLVSTTTFPKS